MLSEGGKPIRKLAEPGWITTTAAPAAGFGRDDLLASSRTSADCTVSSTSAGFDASSGVETSVAAVVALPRLDPALSARDLFGAGALLGSLAARLAPPIAETFGAFGDSAETRVRDRSKPTKGQKRTAPTRFSSRSGSRSSTHVAEIACLRPWPSPRSIL